MAITSIDKLMGRTFFVPSYQRGYRWGRQEVEALLNDLWEFYLQTKEKKDEEERENLLEENKNVFYCLQPISFIRMSRHVKTSWMGSNA